MKLRLALTLAAALFIAEDARAQISVNPDPLPGACGIRLIAYGGLPSSNGCYRFDGVAGERVRVQVSKIADGPTPAASVTRPDGSSSCWGTRPTCFLPQTGRYSVGVNGPHRIAIQRMANPVGCTQIFGGNGPTRKTLVTGELKCFRVNSDAGVRLRIRVVALSGNLRPTVEVLRPDGLTRCEETHGTDFTCATNAGGVHTVFVRDGSSIVGGPGEIAISVQNLAQPGNCPVVSFATTAHYSGLSGGAMECYRFDAAVGDRVRVRLHVEGEDPAIHPQWEIVRPDGTTLCGVHPSESQCTIDAAGRHAVFIRDAQPGTGSAFYRFSVQRMNAPVGCSTATFGPGAVSGRRDLDPGQTHCYTFSGAAGDRVRIRPVAGFPWMRLGVTVIRPDGSQLCTVEECKLDATGQHLVLIRDHSQWGFGVYWWTLQRHSDPVGCGTLVRGAPAIRGSVGLAGSTCFRFEAVEDEWVEVDITDVFGEWEMASEIISPNGYSLGAGSSEQFWVPQETGTHTLIMRDGGRGLDSGQFDVRLP